VIVVFALAVRLSFESVMQQQISARLETLARAGTAAIEFNADSFTVNARTLGGFAVRLGSEGVQWFDASGKLVASRGRVPQHVVPPVLGRAQISTSGGSLDTASVAIIDSGGHRRGYVRAGEAIDEMQEGKPALNLGLVVGSILAIITATLGGGLLAGRPWRNASRASSAYASSPPTHRMSCVHRLRPSPRPPGLPYVKLRICPNSRTVA
jgi:hypothetical protein